MGDGTRRSRARRRWALSASCAAWLGLVALGYGLLYEHAFTAGAAADAPSDWPSGLAFDHSVERPTLVMVAHPRCSCTRASIAELARLMTRLSSRVEGYVIFQRPAGTPPGWEKTDLWRSASLIDGVTPIVDEGGRQAERFGATTSGQTYLFDADGALLFSGGITPSRAHQGNSVGRERIIALVLDGDAERRESDVYGCPLDEEEARRPDRERSTLEVAEFGSTEQ